MRTSGILVTRLVTAAALTISVLRGPFALNHRGTGLYPIIVALLFVIVLSFVAPYLALENDKPRRRLNVIGLVGLTFAGAALCVLAADGSAIAVPFVAAVFIPTAQLPRRAELALVAVNVLALWGFCVRSASPWWAYPAVAAGVLAGYQAGLRTRERAERADTAEVMLAQEQALRAERDRAAAAAERQRIAGDLHDLLAHTLSGLAITLQGASMLLEADRPEEAAEQVKRARALAVEGLTEARAAVSALSPAQGLVAVDLRAGIERAAKDHQAIVGSPVTVTAGELPPVTGLVTSTALAILREALTNAVRHAPGAPVNISAGRVGDNLEVVISDDAGQAAPLAAIGGMGVAGMKSRALAVGGTVVAGPTATGWAVTVTVPIAGMATGDASGDVPEAGIRVAASGQAFAHRNHR